MIIAIKKAPQSRRFFCSEFSPQSAPANTVALAATFFVP
jgi:hypothetical protein